VKLCAYIAENGASCAQPALKRSPDGLCRLHAPLPRRQANQRRAQAEIALAPGRKAQRAQRKFLVRNRRALMVPMLDSLPALEAGLDRTMRAWEIGLNDARVTRAMLAMLRVAYAAVCLHPGSTVPVAERRGFRKRLSEARLDLQAVTQMERLERMAKSGCLEKEQKGDFEPTTVET